MKREHIIRPLIVVTLIVVGFAFGDDGGFLDPDGTALIPIMLLFGSLSGVGRGSQDLEA